MHPRTGPQVFHRPPRWSFGVIAMALAMTGGAFACEDFAGANDARGYSNRCALHAVPSNYLVSNPERGSKTKPRVATNGSAPWDPVPWHATSGLYSRYSMPFDLGETYKETCLCSPTRRAVPSIPVIAQADDGPNTLLAWRFKQGDTFQLQRVYQQSQVIEVKSNTIKHSSTSTWVDNIEVGKVDANEAVLKITLASIDRKDEGKKPDAKHSFFWKKLAGTKFTAIVSRAGRIKAFAGYDQMIAKLVSEGENAATYRALVPEASLRDGLEEVLGFLPTDPVQPAATWQRQATEPMPPFGSFQTTFAYQYNGSTAKGHEIDCKLTMQYELPAKDVGLLRVVKGKLQANAGKAKIWFDAQRDPVVQGQRGVRIEGTLTIDGAGKEADLKFRSDNSLQWQLKTAK